MCVCVCVGGGGGGGGMWRHSGYSTSVGKTTEVVSVSFMCVFLYLMHNGISVLVQWDISTSAMGYVCTV